MVDDLNGRLPEDSQPRELAEGSESLIPETLLVGNNGEGAQIDPRYFAPGPSRPNAQTQRTRTSLLYVLFEYCLEEGLLHLHFIDQCDTVWRLDQFANASFHSHFRQSVAELRYKIREDSVWRNRLLKQHWNELQRLTYPMPKRKGKRPKRKRGYSDKGSTRPLHQRFRTDKETQVSVYLEDLRLTQKVVVYGRRPSVTYRRLPFSEEIGRLLKEGFLKIEGDFIVPTGLKED